MNAYESDSPAPGKTLIPVVIFQFHSLPDFWLHKGQYELEGKFSGTLKYLQLSFKDVKKVHHLQKYASSFPTNEWEG